MLIHTSITFNNKKLRPQSFDLTATDVHLGANTNNLGTTKESNLRYGYQAYGVLTQLYFPIVANELYEISLDYF